MIWIQSFVPGALGISTSEADVGVESSVTITILPLGVYQARPCLCSSSTLAENGGYCRVRDELHMPTHVHTCQIEDQRAPVWAWDRHAALDRCTKPAHLQYIAGLSLGVGPG